MVLNVAASTASGKMERVVTSAKRSGEASRDVLLSKIDIEIHQVQDHMRPQAKIDATADRPSHPRILIACSAKVFGACHYQSRVVIINTEVYICLNIEIRLTDCQTAGDKAHQTRRKHIAQPRSHRGVPVQSGLCGRVNC